MCGGVVDIPSLISLYDKEDMEDMLITLAFTSLQNRTKDLFGLIRKQRSGKVVLDYGHGVSTHGIACAQKGCIIYGVGVSRYLRNISNRRYANRGLKAELLNIGEIDSPDMFDTILCTDVFEHVPDPEQLLKSMTKWLRFGGVLHARGSKMVNYKKGHLPLSVKSWFGPCQIILKDCFDRISSNNFILRRKYEQ